MTLLRKSLPTKTPFSAVAELVVVSVLLSMAISTNAWAGDINSGTSDTKVNSGVRVDDVTTLNGNVTVEGTVADSISILNGNVTLRPGSKVVEDVNIGNGTVTVERGAVLGGNANLANGKISVANGGLIEGDARLITGYIKAPPGTIKGERSKGSDAFELLDASPDIDFGVPGWFGMTLAALLMSVVLAALFPQLFRAFSTRIDERPWLSGLVGLSAAIWVPAILVFLAVTIIGILLIPLFVSALVVAWFLGWFGFSFFIGARFLRVEMSKRGNVILAMVLGVVILRLLDLIPVAGSLVNAFGALFAFGALTLLVLNERGEQQRESVTG